MITTIENAGESPNSKRRTADRIRVAMAASYKGCGGQGRLGVDSAGASRLLLVALQKLVNRLANQP